MKVNHVYAPVLIPTLCRYDHFRRCVESLSRCTHADKTDLIIGLDYPLKENHWDGYLKISNYVDTITGFADIIVLRTDHNLGFGLNGNMARLVKYAKERYDRYIGTEDDNEFSPCFLDFMNKALEYYKDNSRVSTVCGFNQYQVKSNHVIFTYDNSGWGAGFWIRKDKPAFDENYSSLKRFSNILKILKFYPRLLATAITMIDQKKVWGDVRWTCHNIINDRMQVRPSISLVRNNGLDGSGEHSNISNAFNDLIVSDDKYFDYSFDNPKRTKEVERMVRHNMMPKSQVRFMISYISIIRKAITFYFTGRK